MTTETRTETLHEARCRAAGITPAQFAAQDRTLDKIIAVGIVLIVALLIIILS